MIDNTKKLTKYFLSNKFQDQSFLDLPELKTQPYGQLHWIALCPSPGCDYKQLFPSAHFMMKKDHNEKKRCQNPTGLKNQK